MSLNAQYDVAVIGQGGGITKCLVLPNLHICGRTGLAFIVGWRHTRDPNHRNFLIEPVLGQVVFWDVTHEPYGPRVVPIAPISPQWIQALEAYSAYYEHSDHHGYYMRYIEKCEQEISRNA